MEYDMKVLYTVAGSVRTEVGLNRLFTVTQQTLPGHVIAPPHGHQSSVSLEALL